MEDLVSAPDRFWRDRNVFVTGCTGLLGSWLTEALLERQAHVIGLVRDWVPQSRLFGRQLDKRITIVRGAVEEFATLERTLNEYEIETVFHLAAQTIVETANRNPPSTFETNIAGTWRLLEATRRVPTVKRVVIASSDKAYGAQPTLPYLETAPLKASNPYDVSKACGDLLGAAYFATYGLPITITRCGNFYGGGDLNFNRLVPGTIRSVLRGERPIIRSDGTLIRDYFYIEDAAQAYLMLAEKMEDPAIHGEAFNFSHEAPVTVMEMTHKILKLMGREDLRPVIQNTAQHEIANQSLSAKKARTMLGWQPRFTLEDGLTNTVAWYREYLAEAGAKRPRRPTPADRPPPARRAPTARRPPTE